MSRILFQILCVVLVSSAAAATANLTVYKMDWIRKPPPPPTPVDTGETDAEGESVASGDSINADQMLDYLTEGNAWIVDARNPEEFAEGHVANAINIPSNEVFDRADQFMAIIPPDALIIVYCGGGNCESSHIVADALRRDFGFDRVVIYTNGWEEILAQYDRFAECVQIKGGQ